MSAADEEALAEQALATVEDLLDDGVADPGTGGVVGEASAEDTLDADHDLTLALRDLAARASSLSDEDRETAERLLARPAGDGSTGACTEGGPTGDAACYATDATVKTQCSTAVCVHWVNKGAAVGPGERGDSRNAVPVEDDGAAGAWPGTGGDGTPDYVEVVLEEMDHVAGTYADAGYRAAVADDGNGGSDLPDIYLGEIGQQGLYGYCTTDDPAVLEDDQDGSAHVATWAYCVLDNDYAAAQFPRHTPRENLQVTAAHEYFHAIQYGYDVDEDSWILEATATWVEDFVYDDVNDNVGYLSSGPLRQPQQSVDTYGGSAHYGAWIFFKYLTDRFPAAEGGLPVLVRELWESMAHDGAGAQRYYSVQAVDKALRARGRTLNKVFPRFVAANRRPDLNYDESRSQNYPKARLSKTAKLTKRNGRFSYTPRLDHLAARHVRLLPRARGRFQVRIGVDVNDVNKGGVVLVTVKRKGKPATVKRLTLKSDGTKFRRVGFTRKHVAWVEVAIVNASTRFRCNLGYAWTRTCQGSPRDDNRPQSVRAVLVRPKR